MGSCLQKRSYCNLIRSRHCWGNIMKRDLLGPLLLAFLFCGLPAIAAAQVISSVVGTVQSDDSSKATETPLITPRAVVADQDGLSYVCDDSSQAVRRIDPLTANATVI